MREYEVVIVGPTWTVDFCSFASENRLVSRCDMNFCLSLNGEYAVTISPPTWLVKKTGADGLEPPTSWVTTRRSAD